MSISPEYDLNQEWLMLERAQTVRVKKVGRVSRNRARPCGWTVLDPHGREVKWLSVVFAHMGTGNYSPATFRTYADSFLRIARCAWALDIDMFTLRPEQYSVLRSVLKDPARNSIGRAYKPNSLLSTEDGLKSIYSYAEFHHVIEGKNPVQAVVDGPDLNAGYARFTGPWDRRAGRRKSRIAKRPRGVLPILAVGEFKTLTSVSNCLDATLVQVLSDAGPRISEVLSITLAAINREEHEIEVRCKSPGGDGTRTIPTTDDTFDSILRYVEYLADAGVHIGPNDPIFRSEVDHDKPLTRFDAYHRLVAIVPRANPQKLRRTTATWLLDDLDGPGDARLLDVRDTLGHAQITTTMRYLRQERREQVSRFLETRARGRREPAVELGSFYSYDVRAHLENLKADS